MKKRGKRILLIVGGIVALVIVSFVGLVASVLYSFDFSDKYPHRPDAELIQIFRDHRAEFERVRTMAMSDPVILRVDENWTDPPNLASDTVSEFRELFEIMKTPRGISKYRSSGELEIIGSAVGWVASGSTKGYLYAERKPIGTIMESLDDPEVLVSVGDRYLKPIEGSWYLFFER